MRHSTLATEVGVSLIEFFKYYTGWSDKKFLKYMHDNNIWSVMDYEDDVLILFGHDSFEETVEWLGHALSDSEREQILENYTNKKYKLKYCFELDQFLSHKNARVVEFVMNQRGIPRSTATWIWFNSKIKRMLNERGRYYIFVSSLYYELCLEERRDDRWMTDDYVIQRFLTNLYVRLYLRKIYRIILGVEYKCKELYWKLSEKLNKDMV